MKKVIYVAGKYRARTIFGVIWNILKARKKAIELWKEGWVVICPHMNTALFDGHCEDNVWLDGDLEIVKRCDAIYMSNGFRDSKGAMEELYTAISAGLEIYMGE